MHYVIVIVKPVFHLGFSRLEILSTTCMCRIAEKWNTDHCLQSQTLFWSKCISRLGATNTNQNFNGWSTHNLNHKASATKVPWVCSWIKISFFKRVSCITVDSEPKEPKDKSWFIFCSVCHIFMYCLYIFVCLIHVPSVAACNDLDVLEYRMREDIPLQLLLYTLLHLL